MDLNEILENYNPQWFSELRKEGIFREKYLKLLKHMLKEKEISILVGLRRIGKTTLLKQFMYLLQTELGVDGKYIFYLSLDHPLIQRYELGDILKEYRKINEISRNKKIYLFLDEILYGKNSFQWLKVFHDNENVKIYATSSSSLDLKNQKSFLTGRHRTIRIKPLSFSEYLLFRGKKTHEQHLLERYFEEYLRDGGIPRYVLTKDISYLTNLAEDIIMKDVGQKVKNPLKLKELFLMLVNRIGKNISYSKIARLLSIKEETVAQYMSHLSFSELIHIVYRCSKSYNERIYSPKKVYLGDVGFRYALTGKYAIGSNFENIVFLDILEKDPCYYLENGIEIDFITKKDVYECKLDSMKEKQKKLLTNFKKKGYKVHLVNSFRDFPL